jgi:arsenate reductase-like glutaredoxin family protein
VKSIVGAAGGVAKVLNPRHETAKAKGWAEKPPSVDEFAAAVAKDPNLLRRPILISGKKVLVGYDKKNLEDWAKL